MDSTAHSLSEDPGGTGLQIDPCGEIFGVHFLLQQTDKELALPQELGNFPRLCAVGDRLVALPATSSGEWLTFSSIVEFLRDRRHPWPYDTSERKIPGGAIAVEWTKDRRELSTLSANGLMLSWPATVSQPTEELVKLAPARERTQETWPEVDRRGEIVAVGLADHAGVDIRIYSVSTRRLVSSARVNFEAKDAPPNILSDPHFILGQLRVVRFSADAKELLVGVQSGKGSQLVVIDSQTDLPLRRSGLMKEAWRTPPWAMDQ